MANYRIKRLRVVFAIPSPPPMLLSAIPPTVAHSIALLAGDTGRSYTTDFPGEQSADPWLYRLYYPLCVSCRIDTWQIVYLSYKEPCPTISIHKRYIDGHGRPLTTMVQQANAHGHGSCTEGGTLYCLIGG